MDGIDLLLSGQDKPSMTGLDVLLGASAPKPPVIQPTRQGSVTGGMLQGVNDVQNGAAQWLYNMLPKGAQDAGDAVDHWLYDKSGGQIGTKPGLGFNAAVADQNKTYEADRAANGRDGIDWARGGAAGGVQAALSAVMPQMSVAKAGMVAGALMPDTSNPSNLGDYAGRKAADVTLGGATGGMFGMGGNLIASTIKPRVTAAAQSLIDSGVSLTPGQMLGGVAKTVEDKLTSLPLVGDAIKGAMGRGTESLNTAAYQRVLKPLGEAGFSAQLPKGVGREAVDSISNQVSDAYNKLLPKLTTQMDPQFARDVGRLSEMATTGNLGEAEAKQFGNILQTQVLDKFMGQNAITGETMKQMESKLGEIAGNYRGQPLGGAVMELQANLRSLVQRSNPEFAPQLAKINEAFANLTRVQSAAATQGAPNGVFSAAQLSAAVKGGDKTVRDNAFGRGKALMQDLSDPAKSLLTSSVPDSGTAGRVGAIAGAGALLSHPAMLADPTVLTGLGLATFPALAYSKVGLPLLQKAFTARPQGAGLLSDAVRKGTQKATPAASGGLLELLSDQAGKLNPWAVQQ